MVKQIIPNDGLKSLQLKFTFLQQGKTSTKKLDAAKVHMIKSHSCSFKDVLQRYHTLFKVATMEMSSMRQESEMDMQTIEEPPRSRWRSLAVELNI